MFKLRISRWNIILDYPDGPGITRRDQSQSWREREIGIRCATGFEHGGRGHNQSLQANSGKGEETYSPLASPKERAVQLIPRFWPSVTVLNFGL